MGAWRDTEQRRSDPGNGDTREDFFEDSPVPLWLEDLSGPRAILAGLHADGVADLHAHLGSHPETLAKCAASMRIVDVNSATIALFGAPDRATLFERFPSILTDASRQALRAKICRLFGGERRFTVDTNARRLDGELIWFDLHVSLTATDPGDWSRTLVATSDRTERHRAEQSLQESEARFRTLYEHGQAMINQFDEAGRCILWNRACEQNVGYAAAEVQACDTPLSLFYPDPDARGRVQTAITVADGSFGRYEVRAKDGSTRIQLWANFRLLGGARIALGHDITELEASESERQELEARILHAQKLESLGVLAGGIAHDFNNLLVGVLGNADLARRELAEGKTVSGHLSDIEVAAQRGAELANQMLAYSGKGRFSVEPTDVGVLLRDLRTLLGASLSKKTDLYYQIQDELPAVDADATQLRQVFFNLIVNASEALDGKPGRIDVHATLQDCSSDDLAQTYVDDELPAGRYLALEVSDTGAGMTADVARRVFDPFFTTKRAGRGLGLAATLGIVRSHGGAIAVQSTPASGSTFRVLLPASSSAARVSTDPERPEVAWQPSGAVLVVDDEHLVRSVAVRMLRRIGFEVLEAGSGAAALDCFNSSAGLIEAVVLDLAMPGLDGREVLAQLRKVAPRLPVLLSSGYTALSIEAELNDPHTAFVQKPYKLTTLRRVLRQLLAVRP